MAAGTIKITKKANPFGLLKKAYAFGIESLDFRKRFYYKRHLLFEKDLSSHMEDIAAPLITDMSLKMVSDPAALEALIGGDRLISSLAIFQDFKDELTRGGILFLVMAGREFVHAGMVILERETAVLLDPLYKGIDYANAGYIGPCYTQEKYRGRGIYPYVLSEICVFLKNKGIARALINTKANNKASTRGITKAGFKEIAEIHMVKLLFFEFQKRMEHKDHGI